MRHVFWLCLLTACTLKTEYPMSGTTGTDADALEEVQSALKKDPENKALIFRWLYLNQQMGWTQEAESRIAGLLVKEGLTPELYALASDYYGKTEQEEKILALLDGWMNQSSGSLEDEQLRIETLVNLGRYVEANVLLLQMLRSTTDDEALYFVASQYLEMQDTVMSVRAFYLLSQASPAHRALRSAYLPLLLHLAQYREAARVLNEWGRGTSGDFQLAMSKATVAYRLGNPQEAIGELRRWEEPAAHDSLSRWYLEQKEWDSAIYFTDRLLETDSSSAWMLRKGMIHEQRGALQSAYGIYAELSAADTTWVAARERKETVARKIAYLRQLRAAAEELPLIELKPKKPTDQ